MNGWNGTGADPLLVVVVLLESTGAVVLLVVLGLVAAAGGEVVLVLVVDNPVEADDAVGSVPDALFCCIVAGLFPATIGEEVFALVCWRWGSMLSLAPTTLKLVEETEDPPDIVILVADKSTRYTTKDLLAATRSDCWWEC